MKNGGRGDLGELPVAVRTEASHLPAPEVAQDGNIRPLDTPSAAATVASTLVSTTVSSRTLMIIAHCINYVITCLLSTTEKRGIYKCNIHLSVQLHYSNPTGLQFSCPAIFLKFCSRVAMKRMRQFITSCLSS